MGTTRRFLAEHGELVVSGNLENLDRLEAVLSEIGR